VRLEVDCPEYRQTGKNIIMCYKLLISGNEVTYTNWEDIKEVFKCPKRSLEK